MDNPANIGGGDKRVMNRGLVVVGAILIQLCLGAIYAWSVFTKALTEAGWSKTQTQAVFSAGLAMFAIVMVIAGRMMPRLGPRKLAMAGGIVLGVGYALAGLLGAENFWVTFLLVGIVGGAGIGLGYVVPIAVGMKWFPDKKGLITGLAVAGFGFGATLWMTLADSLGRLGGGHLLAVVGLSNTFLVYGIAYFVIVFVGSLWMVFPPEGYRPPGWETRAAGNSGRDCPEAVDLTSGQMLRTPQFYLILLTFAFGASAGLMSIGLMKLFPMQALCANGMAKEDASSIATMAMGVFFALANGIGRIAWGTISDKLGRKLSIVIMMASQGVFVILFQRMAGNVATLYLFAVLIGFNFGGNFALFPTITADTFGTKHIGQNYGWVFLAYALGGVFGPILGGRLGDLGNFPLAFTICGVLCLVAAGVIVAVRHPKAEPATS
jgi:OFA family oxalate/formate antiporter-like MFS transporter